jgi:RNA polymerase sigma factor for flagellar operon FliA
MKAAMAYSGIGSAESADDLVRRHAELVKRIAYHLAGRLPSSVEVDDLIQAGMLGLLEAASHYAADRGRASLRRHTNSRRRCSMHYASSTGRRVRCIARRVRQRRQCERSKRSSGAKRVMARSRRAWVSIDEYHRVMHDASSCQIAVWMNYPRHPCRGPVPEPTARGAERQFREALAAALRIARRERLVMSMYYDDELNLKRSVRCSISQNHASASYGQALVKLSAAGQLAGNRE